MTAKKKRMGADPLDALTGGATPKKRSKKTVASEGWRARGTPSDRESSSKKRATFVLSSTVVEEFRGAALRLSGYPHFATLGGLVEEALREKLDKLRKDHNGGDPFPAPDRELRRGRAPKG